MDNGKQKISIVVTYLPIDDDVERITAECINRIKEYTYNPFEIIRVNNSMFRYAHETRETWKHDLGDDRYMLNNNANHGNGRAWDQGVKEASNDIIILMDNDCWPLEKDWDKEMVEKLSDPQTGITFPSCIVGQDIEKYQAGLHVDFFPRRDGFCFAFKRETYNKVGEFLCDQPFKLGYYEDDYFEFRVQYELGLKLVGCRSSKVWHKGQATTKKMWSKEVAEGIEANKKWYEEKTGNRYPYLS